MNLKCNVCGESISNMLDVNASTVIERVLAFGSKYDGEHVKIHICCKCLDNLIDNCVTSPIIENERK